MPDQPGSQHPPAYFANVVTTNLYPDELVMELRRHFQEHKILGVAQGTQPADVAPPSAEEIFRTEPIARVVLTFTAAKGLKDYLDQAIPIMEKRRRAQ